MPIYEYRCAKCAAEFEKMVKLNAPIPSCPACGDEEVTKLISASSFVLKGGGWYRDHYGLKSGGDSKPAGESPVSSKSEDSSDKSSSSSGTSDSSGD